MSVPEDRLSALVEIQRDWWLYLLLGLCVIVLGIVAISLPLVAALTIQVLIGVLLIVGSVFMAVYGIKLQGAGRKMLGFAVAVLYLVFGIVFLGHPIAGILALTLFLAAFFLIEGGFKIVASIEHRGLPNWGWGLFSGIVSLILGIIIWTGWPASTVWAIGLLVGIDLIFSGWWIVMLGLALHALPTAGGRMVEQH